MPSLRDDVCAAICRPAGRAVTPTWGNVGPIPPAIMAIAQRREL